MFLMISGGTEVYKFAYIRLILEAKFGEDPEVRRKVICQDQIQRKCSVNTNET